MASSTEATKPRKKAAPKLSVASEPERHVCDFCKQGFVREETLFTHLCERKRRHLQREEKPVKFAFIAFQRFYVRSMGRSRPPGMDAFEKSSLYTAFVRFGRWVHTNNTLNPLGYVDFLLKMQVGIDKWENQMLYETYVRELSKSESATDAMERNLMLMESWAIDTGENWVDFFRKIAPARAALWIRSGRISPWILFTAPSAHELLERFSPEQAAMVEQAIDPQFWAIKLERHDEEVAHIKQVLLSAGV